MEQFCYKTSNNKFFNSPPRMSDGRHFTDYRSNCRVDQAIQYNNNIMSSYQYKRFIMKNADRMRKLNRVYACQKNCVKSCPNQVNIPLQKKIICNGRNCIQKTINKNGVGIGVNYGNSSTGSDYSINSLSPNNNCLDYQEGFNYFKI